MTVYFHPLPPMPVSTQVWDRLNLGASAQVNRDSTSSGDGYEPPASQQNPQEAAQEAAQTSVQEEASQDLLQQSQRDVRRLCHTLRNANDAVAMLQIAEDAFVKLSPSLVRLQSLLSLYQQGALYQDEFAELYQQMQYIEYVISLTQFRNIPLFGASGQRNTLVLRLGEGANEQFQISFELPNLRLSSFSLDSFEGMQEGIERCQQALMLLGRDKERFATLRQSIQAVILRLLNGRSAAHFPHTPLRQISSTTYLLEETRSLLLQRRGTAASHIHMLAAIADDLISES